jgi:3-hydroxyisobutyrate dehydrogenase-like beta-hydroxyacid dehydrogenase
MDTAVTLAPVALIGLGEVGQILAEDLYAAGVNDVAAYDILFRDPTSAPSRAQVPAKKCASAEEAVRGRPLVISAVTAASDLDAAQSVAPVLTSQAFYLDLNSVSPLKKKAGAKIVNEAGGRYVEAAVMTPFAPKRIASPMLLGGYHAEAFQTAFGNLGFSTNIFSKEYGQAAAAKMCRSVMIKGIEALLTESLLAARHYGVDSAVLASLSDLLPIGDWTKLAVYMITRSLEHGRRRAEEMREVSDAIFDAGIDPLMSKACSKRQEWAASYSGVIANNQPALGVILDSILSTPTPKVTSTP